MLSERQADIRKEYRSRIAGWYNGYFHVSVIYLMGGLALFYYLQHIHGVLSWFYVIYYALTS